MTEIEQSLRVRLKEIYDIEESELDTLTKVIEDRIVSSMQSKQEPVGYLLTENGVTEFLPKQTIVVSHEEAIKLAKPVYTHPAPSTVTSMQGDSEPKKDLSDGEQLVAAMKTVINEFKDYLINGGRVPRESLAFAWQVFDIILKKDRVKPVSEPIDERAEFEEQVNNFNRGQKLDLTKHHDQDRFGTYLSDATECAYRAFQYKCSHPANLKQCNAIDAARYRWLRDSSKADIRTLLKVDDFTTLDSFIDAARKP